MDRNTIDWSALERLRTAFLAGTAGAGDYWQSEADLTSYDATFAQRIGWKWDYVLAELTRRGWSPPKSELLDWGCGSGIAARAFLDHFGADAVRKLRVWDRSSQAMDFAARRARTKYPGLEVAIGLTESPGVVLLSHVLTELDAETTSSLVDLAARAECVLWIEPGTYEASRALIAIRERLRDHFNVVAPCTHQTACGMLAPQNQRHWCHHFASPPSAVFTDGYWARFANLIGIDLRDLPLSFLVLDKRSVAPMPSGAARVIGHPRVYKAHALLLGCDADGVHERQLAKRTLPEEFRRWKKGEGCVLQVWQREGDAITGAKDIPFG